MIPLKAGYYCWQDTMPENSRQTFGQRLPRIIKFLLTAFTNKCEYLERENNTNVYVYTNAFYKTL